jgi:hypothetical protein
MVMQCWGSANVYPITMEFPYSIYVWHAPRKPTDEPFWQEELRADYQQMAVYAATVLYNAVVPSQDTIQKHPVIKVMRYGLTIQAFPSVHVTDLCDQWIARWNEEHPHLHHDGHGGLAR